MNKFILLIILLLGMQGVSLASPKPGLKLQDSKQALARALGNITPDTIDEFAAWYAPNARFVDPEAQKQGREQIAAYFKEMLNFIEVEDTRINKVLPDGASLVVFWDSYISLKGQPLDEFKSVRYEMISVLELDEQVKIIHRKDYFDQLSLYQKVPQFKEKLNMMLESYISAGSADAP